MKRIHAFEFEDLKWFPKVLRDNMTDYLQFVANRFDIHKTALPILKKGLEKSGANRIVDICSGGGGGLLTIMGHLKESHPDLKVLLTDYYPNIPAFKRTVKLGGEKNFAYSEQSIDARKVPKDIQGFRTQFLSFHHFTPEMCRQILQNAVDNRSVIGIFEIQQRKLIYIVPMLFLPIVMALLTPFIKPFKWSRILFTYLIPLIPLFSIWDGIISVLRTYTVEEMKSMANSLTNGDGYVWEIGETTPNKPTSSVLYLLGYPK